MQNLELQRNEIHLLMEAISVWSCEISEARYAIHEQSIDQILCKLHDAMQKSKAM